MPPQLVIRWPDNDLGRNLDFFDDLYPLPVPVTIFSKLEPPNHSPAIDKSILAIVSVPPNIATYNAATYLRESRHSYQDYRRSSQPPWNTDGSQSPTNSILTRTHKSPSRLRKDRPVTVILTASDGT